MYRVKNFTRQFYRQFAALLYNFTSGIDKLLLTKPYLMETVPKKKIIIET